MNIKEAMARMGVHDMGTLETMAKEFLRKLPEEERKALKKEFRQKRSDESFQEIIEGSYEEISNEFKHKESRDSEG